jgi:hydrogenase maturation protein HypF
VTPGTVVAHRIRVRGIVQGVGFRPFVFRLAEMHRLAGSVRNVDEGVEIAVEGPENAVAAFVRDLLDRPPAVARVAEIDVQVVAPAGYDGFHIRESGGRERPSVQISPDLPTCDDCLQQLFDPGDRRHGYPYINCTHCGPRFSLITGLPYDRDRTTMAAWEMCAGCAHEFGDGLDRRFHAQPIACPRCGPRFRLIQSGTRSVTIDGAIDAAAQRLRRGEIVAIKGLGGYHLSCDAEQRDAVTALRQRKYRETKPFALMVRNVSTAHRLVELRAGAETLLLSSARPIVLAPARIEMPEVAPGLADLGIMLPYAPLHHLLFAAGAPDVLVMTSGNRSNEPMAFTDDDALERLTGIADALLVGERAIARRVDDSVARVMPCGPAILRRARGYAPAAVAHVPTRASILAVGGDLKNTVTLVVGGEAIVSQHIGDLEHYAAYVAFQETIRDLLQMYDVDVDDLTVVHDRHPQYAATGHALAIPARRHCSVQHHRAHVASVLAERGALAERVLGIAFDGTGFGDDGSIWGGEFLVGSVRDGFERVAHLKTTWLPGGDAAAKYPAQAAAGFVDGIDDLPDLAEPPFLFPQRYHQARRLVQRKVRTFATTSVGRLFDVVAALVGFTQEISYEGQAAVWLEQLAARSTSAAQLPFEFQDDELDFRPALRTAIELRRDGEESATIARGFHIGLARATADVVRHLCRIHDVTAVVLSGGVFQNVLLLASLNELLASGPVPLWTNHAVPPGDGGISLGQAVLAAASGGGGTGGTY